MKPPDILLALIPVVDLFETLGVSYTLVGSLASSAHGVARSTVDADLVASLTAEHVEPIVSRLRADYYVDRGAVEEAVKEQGSFNVVHLPTMLKVDVFVSRGRPFDREVLARSRPGALAEEPESRAIVTESPEDTVLSKLEWFRDSGEVSQKQWADIRGVLDVQEGRLDLDYMRRWATTLGISELLERALAQRP